jgi:hypothetical protein
VALRTGTVRFSGRLIAAGGPVALRLNVGPAFDEARLASALWWL